MKISLWKRAASCVSFAAARACRPSLLVTTRSMDGMYSSSWLAFWRGFSVHNTAQRPLTHALAERIGVFLLIRQGLQHHTGVRAGQEVHDIAFLESPALRGGRNIEGGRTVQIAQDQGRCFLPARMQPLQYPFGFRYRICVGLDVEDLKVRRAPQDM